MQNKTYIPYQDTIYHPTFGFGLVVSNDDTHVGVMNIRVVDSVESFPKSELISLPEGYIIEAIKNIDKAIENTENTTLGQMQILNVYSHVKNILFSNLSLLEHKNR